MGLLLVGLALLAGLGLARVLDQAPGAKPLTAPPGAPPPKAQVGQLVAAFPQGAWGRVQRVTCGADGYRYTVGFANGAAVELRGMEFTRAGAR